MTRYLDIEKQGIIVGMMMTLCIICLFTPYVSWHSLLPVVALSAIAYATRKNNMSPQVIDIVVFVIFLYETMSSFTGINHGTSSIYLMMAFWSLAVYVVCRLCLTSLRRLRRVLLCLSVMEFFILFIGQVSWIQFRHSVYEAGFDSLYEFRSLYAPWGNPVNLWASFLIAFIGNTLLTFVYYRNNKKILVFLGSLFALLIWSGMATFSRTVYILYAFLISGLAVASVIARRSRFIWLAIVSAAAVVLFCTVNGTEDVAKVLHLDSTLSQQRSTAARVQAFASIDDILENHHAFGVGNGNYTLAVNNILYEDDDISFTNYASSGFLQLVTEKGIVGTVIWGIAFVVIFAIFLTGFLRKKRIDSFVVLIMLVMLVGKELTFAVFEDFPAFQSLYIISVTGIINIGEKKIFRFSLLQKYNICLLIVSGLFISFCTVSLARNIISWKGMPDPISKVPDLTDAGCRVGAQFLVTGDNADFEKAVVYLQQAYDINPLDNIPVFNIALLYLERDYIAKSLAICEFLVRSCPDNALYRIGLARGRYLDGDVFGSAREYAKAILLDPRIMDDRQWEEMKIEVPEFYSLLETEIHIAVSVADSENPIWLAKCGKIFLELGEFERAEIYLKKALRMLPNLGKAWYNLGRAVAIQGKQNEAKQYFLHAGLFAPLNNDIKEYLAGENTDLAEHKSPGNFIQKRIEEYVRKYSTWYRRKPETSSVILMTDIF